MRADRHPEEEVVRQGAGSLIGQTLKGIDLGNSGSELTVVTLTFENGHSIRITSPEGLWVRVA